MNVKVISSLSEDNSHFAHPRGPTLVLVSIITFRLRGYFALYTYAIAAAKD